MEKDNTGLTSGVLLELALRCEREEPSLKLNAEIAVACRIGSKLVKADHWSYRNFPTWRARDDGRVEVVHTTDKGGVHWEPEPYTTSLDAAVMLVPEGASWSVTVQGACEAEVTILSGRFLIDGDIERYGRSGVPAKALCAAALRARAALLTDGAEPDTAKAVTK